MSKVQCAYLHKTCNTCFLPPSGPAQDWLQFILWPGGGAGPCGAEAGSAGIRPLEQDCRILSGLQCSGRPHPGGHRGK